MLEPGPVDTEQEHEAGNIRSYSGRAVGIASRRSPRKAPLLNLAEQGLNLHALADQAVQGISAHPWVVHVGIALVFGFGLALSFMGKKLVRPGFILVGMAAGAILGHLAPPALALGGQPLATVAVLALIGGIAGWLFFRVFVANAMGIVLSLAAILATAAYFRVSPPKLDLGETFSSATGSASDEMKDRVSSAIDSARKALEGATSGDSGETKSPETVAMEQAAERSRDLLQELASKLGDQASDFWNYALTPAARFGLAMAAIGGYLVGLVLGFLLPMKASAVTTAIVGPAVWLPAGVYLVHAFNFSFASSLPDKPAVWLSIWGIAAVLGLVVQLAMGSGKKKQNKSESND